MAKKENDKNKEEYSKEINVKDVSWELFKQTKDINYYRLYSALKEKKK